MLIKTQEHQILIQHFGCALSGVNNKFTGDNFCGLYYDWEKGEQVLKTSYFIGACWLEEKQLALYIEPKIKHLDYMSMFLACFKHPVVSKELSKIYKINFDKPKIELNGNSFEITPLLIVHFLQVVRSIVKKGLKKGYYPVRENLNARVKGKINLSATLKRNIFKGQVYKTVCDYQAFGLDCLENRLLKKALIFVQSYLAKSDIQMVEKLKLIVSGCLASFELVGDEVDIRTLKTFHSNAFFKEYSEALTLAKAILKRFAYNLQNTDTKQLTPPFYIDMALLFELYVYNLLLDGNEVKYQVKGNYGKLDFLVDGMIVDTKYKPKYRNKKPQEYEYNIEDIRQLSGYSRDEKIRQKLDLSDEIAKCLIVYPDEHAEELPKELWQQAEPITQFKNFKKIGVKLPQHNV